MHLSASHQTPGSNYPGGLVIMETVARESAMKPEIVDDDSVEFQPNTTPVPNVILDWMMAGLNGAQFKVLMFFVRQKYGFASKRSDSTVEFEFNISNIQNGIAFKLKLPEGDKTWKRVCAGTGLSRDAVSSAIKDLSRLEYLEITRQGSRRLSYKIKVRTGKINGFKADPDQILLDDNSRQNIFGRKNPPIDESLDDNSLQNDGPLAGKTLLLGNQSRKQGTKKENYDGEAPAATPPISNPQEHPSKELPPTQSPPNPKQALVPAAPKRQHYPSKAESAYVEGFTAAMGYPPSMTDVMTIRINKLAKALGDAFYIALPGFFKDDYTRDKGFPIGLLQGNPNAYMPKQSAHDARAIANKKQAAELWEQMNASKKKEIGNG